MSRFCHYTYIESNETMKNNNTTPTNFTPTVNQPVTVYEGDRSYRGSFTGRQYTDGSWQVYFKDSCGDACRRSTNQVEWSVK